MAGVKIPVSKYFLALVPEPGAMAIFESLKHDLFVQFGLRGGFFSPAHITLHKPFEWPENKEQKLISTLEQFKFGPALNVSVRNFNWFEPRVIFAEVIENSQLTAFQKRLTIYCKKELQLYNEYEDLRGFKAHITLASRDLKKRQFEAVKQHFLQQTLSLDLRFTDYVLLKKNQNWQAYKTIKQTNPG